jgi:hypothetical protein
MGLKFISSKGEFQIVNNKHPCYAGLHKNKTTDEAAKTMWTTQQNQQAPGKWTSHTEKGIFYIELLHTEKKSILITPSLDRTTQFVYLDIENIHATQQLNCWSSY